MLNPTQLINTTAQMVLRIFLETIQRSLRIYIPCDTVITWCIFTLLCRQPKYTIKQWWIFKQPVTKKFSDIRTSLQCRASIQRTSPFRGSQKTFKWTRIQLQRHLFLPLPALQLNNPRHVSSAKLHINVCAANISVHPKLKRMNVLGHPENWWWSQWLTPKVTC